MPFSFYKKTYSLSQRLPMPSWAALKGFDLAIEHDLVPKDLIKVNPNPVYTDPYHFLKENG